MLAVLVIASLLWAEPPPARLPAGYRPAGPKRSAQDLIKNADGSFEHRNRDSGFVATIHPDGNVTFRSVPHIRMQSPTLLGFDIRGRRQQAPDDRFNQVGNTLARRGNTADSKRDPVVDFGPYGAPPIMATIGVRIGGLADILTRGKTARARRDFLEDTAPLRAKLRAKYQRVRERESIAELGDTLRRIWADPSLDAASKRRIIFDMWDECIEADPRASPEDAERAKATAKARRVIEAFVRREVPASSTDRFAPSELRRLNALRRSRASFDPYQTR